MPIGHAVEGPHERGVVLAGLDGADREDVAVGARQPPPGRGVGGGDGRHARRDRDHTPGVGAQQLDHLVGHERATACAPTRPARWRAAAGRDTPASPRCTARGSEPGVRSWMVTTRAARRLGGTTKFVPWTTSTGPSSARSPGASIRCHAAAQRPSGHGPADAARRRRAARPASSAAPAPGRARTRAARARRARSAPPTRGARTRPRRCAHR